MTAKKKTTSVRKTSKTEVKTSSGIQSASERRSVEAELKALLEKYVPSHARLVNAVRKSLRKRLLTAIEIVYEYENLGAVVVSFSPSTGTRASSQFERAKTELNTLL